MRFDVTEDRFGPFVLIYCCGNASLKLCKLLDLALVKICRLADKHPVAFVRQNCAG